MSKSMLSRNVNVDMLKFQELFKENGITHVFWAHAVKGQDCFPGYEQIKIMPFPLRPVQATAFAPSRHAARKYLYSFIEPRSDIKTLSNSTKMILANLTGKQGGLVIYRIIRWISIRFYFVPVSTMKWILIKMRWIVQLLLSLPGFCRRASFRCVLPASAPIQCACGNRLAGARFQ